MLQIHENAMPHKGYTALDKKMRDIYKMPVEYNNLHQKGSILCVFNISLTKGLINQILHENKLFCYERSLFGMK